ncbi:MAG: peptidoglycan-associated lipoprotein [Terriglobia bacterium]|nr:MAG: peptidoglycan-associated lipoprotein [Terriglobia bacterium]
MQHSRRGRIVAVAAVALISAACAKKQVAVSTPPSVEAPAAAPAAAPQRTETPARTVPAPAVRPAVTPAARVPDAATRARIDQLLARIEDAYFDYDKAILRPDALKALQADSTELRDIIVQYPDYTLTIEGHCDERGSAEYNLALGDRRAVAANDYLVQVGIPGNQLSVVSYGKEHPVCSEHDETCWQKNRRIHIVAMAR